MQSFPKEISIAVVGTPGCGKSTFVAEDARAYGVEDLAALFAMSGSSISTPFRCKQQTCSLVSLFLMFSRYKAT